MPKFYFINGHRIEDTEGASFPTLQDAEVEAVSAARELASDALRGGKGLVTVTFEIMDEAGTVAAIIPFEKALKPG
jgi:hypothetical protein